MNNAHPKRVRLPLPISFIRCLAVACDAGATCARHLTVERDPLDGSRFIKDRVCPATAKLNYLPVTDPWAA